MTGELAAALAAFQAELPRVKKGRSAEVPTKTGGKYSYTYADLASVTKAVLPRLAAHGLAFTALPQQTPTGFVLVGRLMHTSGEHIEGSLPLAGGGPQELGSAMTYMRRYLLGCLTGIVTEDDDDGAKAQELRVGTSGGRTSRRRPTRPEQDEWSTPQPEPGSVVAGEARAELGRWLTEQGIAPQEAVDRWAAEHNNEHIKDTRDAAGIRAMQAAWSAEVAAQRGAEQ